MAAGLADEHKYLGYLPPETNFGFDRETTIPNDGYPEDEGLLLEEFARRGGTDEDIALASATFMQINNSRRSLLSVDRAWTRRVTSSGKGSRAPDHIQEVGSKPW